MKKVHKILDNILDKIPKTRRQTLDKISGKKVLEANLLKRWKFYRFKHIRKFCKKKEFYFGKFFTFPPYQNIKIVRNPVKLHRWPNSYTRGTSKWANHKVLVLSKFWFDKKKVRSQKIEKSQKIDHIGEFDMVKIWFTDMLNSVWFGNKEW